MLQPALVGLFRREMDRVSGSPREQVLALAALMEKAFFEATKEEQIAFSSLFTRIAYAGQRYSFPAGALQRVQGFRLAAKRARNGGAVTLKTVELGQEALQLALEVLSGLPAGTHFVQETAPNLGRNTAEFPALLRVTALRDLPEASCLVVMEEDDPETELLVQYGDPVLNESYLPSIELIRKVFGFPVTLHLIDAVRDAQGRCVPAAFVIEPDYLVDVSAVSECFKDTGQEPLSYLVRKFLPHETTEPILLGNIANFFLDRLLNEPEAPWQTLFLETFRLFPFVYAPMRDAQVKSLSGKAQKHYLNIRQMALSGLAKEGIDPEDCFLEPSFFSNRYGIQGRLDLFFRKGDKSAIVELKSGTPFKPNSYGISRSHFTQTLLYDLLVRSVYGRQTDPVKYILYSGVDVNPLRFAPTIGPEQQEAIQVRNQLVAIERLLTMIKPGDAAPPVFSRLRASRGKGFTERDFGRFENAYSRLSEQERKYFNAFTGFIAREHWLARVGEESNEAVNGNASLWRSSLEEKLRNFNLISHLQLHENRADQPDPTIVFKKTAETNDLANFRVGDIAVLYPALSESDTVLQHQVIRCTISRMENNEVEVQLRFRQHNLKPFETKGYWRLEPDFLDSGFTSMYRNLLDWAEAGAQARARVLGSAAPAEPDTDSAGKPLIDRIMASNDYFLLWGPPGTGKTSVILRDLSARILRQTSDDLLLLAYTNRAVDEICEALDAIGGDIREQYVRIGSRHACNGRFSGQLLSSKIAGAQNRTELRDVLNRHRIFVSTVASFSQNEALLKLKKFQRLVVDEASQILEPQIAGLLTHFDHFTLIGDHRQLPAVTAQRAENTLVVDPELNAVGITDLRDSYFERLYRLCQQKDWHWAFGQLSQQGRMHEDIMQFPGRWFYDGRLEIWNKDVQKRALDTTAAVDAPEFGKILLTGRVRFLPVNSDVKDASIPFIGQKTSAAEADLCARIVTFFKNYWKETRREWLPEKTLGIITPWRAQIAQIQEALQAVGISRTDVTVDTVERYQGGARDVILISTCAHSEWQLSALVNLSGEGVDRKLNVALTRAREHLIMLGNPEILGKDERYRAFIETYGPE